jgi:hypothetical protein
VLFRHSQGARGALFGAKPASHAFEGHGFIVVVAHKAPQAFRNANKTAHAFILCKAYDPICGLFHRHRGTHFGTITALIANLNPVICPILYHPDGAFFPVFFLEVGLGTNLFAGTAAGTFARISNEFLQDASPSKCFSPFT